MNPLNSICRLHHSAKFFLLSTGDNYGTTSTWYDTHLTVLFVDLVLFFLLNLTWLGRFYRSKTIKKTCALSFVLTSPTLVIIDFVHFLSTIPACLFFRFQNITYSSAMVPSQRERFADLTISKKRIPITNGSKLPKLRSKQRGVQWHPTRVRTARTHKRRSHTLPACRDAPEGPLARSGGTSIGWAVLLALGIERVLRVCQLQNELPKLRRQKMRIEAS